jgi:hypothetical protein
MENEKQRLVHNMAIYVNKESSLDQPHMRAFLLTLALRRALPLNMVSVQLPDMTKAN